MKTISFKPYSPSVTLYSSKLRCFSTPFLYLCEHQMTRTCYIRRRGGGSSIQQQRKLNVKVGGVRSKCDNNVIVLRNQQQIVASSFYRQSYDCSSPRKAFLTTDSSKDGNDSNLSTSTTTTTINRNMEISNQANTQKLEDTNSNNTNIIPTLQETSEENRSTTIRNSVDNEKESIQKLMGKTLQPHAGRLLFKPMKRQNQSISKTITSNQDQDHQTLVDDEGNDYEFIPQVSVMGLLDERPRKRVLVLCTGGTLCMAPDPEQGYSLAPVQGALSRYMSSMNELDHENNQSMPDIVLHEYNPFFDSSDLGPADWVRVAQDIRANYLYYDGFVVLSGTDTMAYFATALSFLLENLGKPVVFTGSQIPLCEPYNDGRRNLIMALLFASQNFGSTSAATRSGNHLHRHHQQTPNQRRTNANNNNNNRRNAYLDDDVNNILINEVTIFFHDRLLRACRTTKVNTHSLLAFDSPNEDPLATIGITINKNEHLLLPPPKGQLRVHSRMDTRILTLRLIPGFDDGMIKEMIQHNVEHKLLRAIILQIYGTGNIPSVKNSFIQLLGDATNKEILVVAATQCYQGQIVMGQYAVGRALQTAGVVSANDMTIEAISCKIGYLFGRNDLNYEQVKQLMGISLRGEITIQ